MTTASKHMLEILILNSCGMKDRVTKGRQKCPQTTPNSLKFVGNHFSHQNRSFWQIKTCCKNFDLNAKGTQACIPRVTKGGTTGIFLKIQKVPQTTPNFLKQLVSTGKNNVLKFFCKTQRREQRHPYYR